MHTFQYQNRLAGVRSWISANPDIHAVLITHLEHVGYISGFSGSNGIVIVTQDRAWFVTDGRYRLQTSTEVTGFEIEIFGQSVLLVESAKLLNAAGFTGGLAIESAYMSVDGYNTLVATLHPGITLTPSNGVVEAVKAIKEPAEIDAIRQACALVDDACAHIIDIVRIGMTEAELAWKIEVYVRERGATRMGFDSIIGSGPNAAIIHGRAGNRGIGSSGEAEFLLCDFGCEINGYNSDITRTFVVGGAPTERMQHMYDTVYAAQDAACNAIKPGIAGQKIDALSRAILSDAGYGNMPHNLGHGLGRLVHDASGLLSPASKLTLHENVVLTVEPGIYIPGYGAVRIEDDVLVTANGFERLTQFSRDLVVIGG